MGSTSRVSLSRDDRDAVDTALVPVRILNEHVYCPRLAWLEWEAKAFVDNADTAVGRDAHRGVDEERGAVRPADNAVTDSKVATSLNLSSEKLGLISKLDKVEFEGQTAIPVETKKGRPKQGKIPVWEPEVAQLTAQVLLLRDHGYDVPRAEVFFAETKTRTTVDMELPRSERRFPNG